MEIIIAIVLFFTITFAFYDILSFIEDIRKDNREEDENQWK